MFSSDRYTLWAPAWRQGLPRPSPTHAFGNTASPATLRQPSTCPGDAEENERWKRDESVKPATTPAPARAAPMQQSVAPPQPESRRIERDVVNIGKSVVIKGELNGSEDLTIEGHVEGKIELKDHVLTIGPNGKIKAQVHAKSEIGRASCRERV